MVRCRLGFTHERDMLTETPAGQAVISVASIDFIQYAHREGRAVIGAEDDSIHTFTGGGKNSGSLHRLTRVLGDLVDDTAFDKRVETGWDRRPKTTIWIRR